MVNKKKKCSKKNVTKSERIKNYLSMYWNSDMDRRSVRLLFLYRWLWNVWACIKVQQEDPIKEEWEIVWIEHVPKKNRYRLSKTIIRCVTASKHFLSHFCCQFFFSKSIRGQRQRLYEYTRKLFNKFNGNKYASCFVNLDQVLVNLAACIRFCWAVTLDDDDFDETKYSYRIENIVNIVSFFIFFFI